MSVNTRASLNRSPRKNWVENAGGLPMYIRRIANRLHAEQGYSIQRAIQTAINTVKRWAAGGTVTARGGPRVTAKTQAQARAALAEWTRKKGSATVSLANPNSGGSVASFRGSGRFPINNTADLRRAILAYGRAKPADKPAIKRYITRRAAALNATNLIPQSWRSGS